MIQRLRRGSSDRTDVAIEGGLQSEGRWRRRGRRSFGMIQRTGGVVIRMPANLKQAAIAPLIQGATIEGNDVRIDK